MAPASRATEGTMSSRVRCVFVALTVVLQLATIYVSWLQPIFRTQALSAAGLALLFAVLTERAAQTVYSDLTPDEWTRFKDHPPISMDDVIAFHEYICAYAGDFSEILDEPLPPE